MRPSRADDLVFVFVAGMHAGTKISQKPFPRTRMACRRPSQKLKSPTTLTRCAEGRKDRESNSRHVVERPWGARPAARRDGYACLRRAGRGRSRKVSAGNDRGLPGRVDVRHSARVRDSGASRREAAFKQAGIMNATQIALVPCSSMTATPSASGRKTRTTGTSPSTCGPR